MLDLRGAVLQHANRGVRLQLLLRAALVVFLLLTIILIPPVQGAAAYYAMVAAYALAAADFARWAWRGGAPSPAGDGSACSPISSCWPA